MLKEKRAAEYARHTVMMTYRCISNGGDRSADPVMMTYLRIGYQCITTHRGHDVSENFMLWQCHGGGFAVTCLLKERSAKE